MPENCAHADCKRAPCYGKACCRHAQLALPLQLALLDAAGQPLVEHQHDQEEAEEVGLAACLVPNCGLPVKSQGLCRSHVHAALALGLAELEGFNQAQLDAMSTLGELSQGMAAGSVEADAYALGLAKLRLRLHTASEEDRERLAREAAEVNAGLAEVNAGLAGEEPAASRCDMWNGKEHCTRPAGHKGKCRIPKSKKAPEPACGAKAAKGNAESCFHPRGHTGPHSDTRRTWRDRKPKAQQAPKRAPKPSDPDFPACSVPQCIDPGAAQGLCATHYRKARRLGIPTTGTYTLAQVDQLSGRTKPPKERR